MQRNKMMMITTQYTYYRYIHTHIYIYIYIRTTLMYIYIRMAPYRMSMRADILTTEMVTHVNHET